MKSSSRPLDLGPRQSACDSRTFLGRLRAGLGCLAAGLATASAAPVPAPAPVLSPSDVVFMYEGARETYQAYDATVLAWGGTPNPKSRAAAQGVRFFGSVGMVTEFGSFHRRVKDRYVEALCRDVEGNPVKVPWLVDHQSEGVPYWWCCTRQPLFREYLEARVVETIRAGADGLHIDDHLGTSGGLWLGLCFCDRCLEGFRSHLQSRGRAALRAVLPDADPATFDFRAEARRWLAESPGRKVTGHPLWEEWSIFQGHSAAAFMARLRSLAADTAGRPVPVGANAGLLWPGHLVDYQALDLFTAETDHHARDRRFSDLPVFAYRLAEAMGRPYAATASGGDWAYVKEHRLPGLVRGWIALSYASGQRLMAPHRQWCHTPEKGTHWYEGPTERFAPLYRFVRAHAKEFDGLLTHADVTVLVPHRAFASAPKPWFDLASRLSAENLAYRLVVAGDDRVERPLTAADLDDVRVLLVPDRARLNPGDQALLDRHPAGRRAFTTLEQATPQLRPAVRVQATGAVRVLPRTGPGKAVLHVLNWDYRHDLDDVQPVRSVDLRCDLQALGVPGATRARWIPAGENPVPVDVPLSDGVAQVPELGLWGLLVIPAP